MNWRFGALALIAYASTSLYAYAVADCSISFEVTDAKTPGSELDGVLYATAGTTFQVQGVLSVGNATSCAANFSTWATDFSALVPVYSTCPPISCGTHQTVNPVDCTCMCEDGWTGADCGMCESDDSCAAFTGWSKSECETAGTYSGYTVNKTMSCTVDALAGFGLNYINCDILAGTCHSMTGNLESTSSGANQVTDVVMDCYLSRCSFYTSSFVCKESDCDGLVKAPKGEYTGDCDAAGNCVISIGSSLSFDAVCSYGDCTQKDSIPISDEATHDNSVALSLGEVVLITLAVGITPVLLFYVCGVWSGLGFVKKEETMVYRMANKVYPLIHRKSSSADKERASGDKNMPAPFALEMKKLDTADESMFRQSVVPETLPLGRNVSDADTFCLEFRNLTVKTDSGVMLLNNASGYAESKSIMAILGPSGAGKSTLIHALVNRPSTGTITTGNMSIDGKGIGPWYRSVCAFVPQDDLLFPTLTVRETVAFAALMKLSEDVPKSTKENIIESLLVELGLAHVSDVLVGDHVNKGVSGGERRRLTIAVEIVTGPRVLILDEPTSGLDSKTAENVMKTLAFLASSNRVVVCSIHQPGQKIFSLLGRCMFLANGACMYEGTANELIQYLDDVNLPCPMGSNLAEHMIECISDEYGREVLLTQYKSKPPKHLRTRSASLATGWLEQAEEDAKRRMRALRNPFPILQLLYQRQFIHSLRHPSLFRLHLLVSIIGGIVTGVLFYDVENTFPGFQNRIGALFFCLCFFSFCALSALPAFAYQWQIVVRETRSKAFGLGQYLLSAVTMDLLMLRFLPACLYCAIFYPMMGLRSEIDRFVFFLVVIALANLVAGAFMTFFSAFMRDASAATLIASICLLISLLFGGLFLNAETMPNYLDWLQLLSYFWYAYESLCINELQGLMISLDLDGIGSAKVLGDKLLLNIGMDPDHKTRNCYILLGYGLLLYALAWAGLMLQLNREKYQAKLKEVSVMVKRGSASFHEESKSASIMSQSRDTDLVTEGLAL